MRSLYRVWFIRFFTFFTFSSPVRYLLFIYVRSLRLRLPATVFIVRCGSPPRRVTAYARLVVILPQFGSFIYVAVPYLWLVYGWFTHTRWFVRSTHASTFFVRWFAFFCYHHALLFYRHLCFGLVYHTFGIFCLLPTYLYLYVPTGSRLVPSSFVVPLLLPPYRFTYVHTPTQLLLLYTTFILFGFYLFGSVRLQFALLLCLPVLRLHTFGSFILRFVHVTRSLRLRLRYHRVSFTLYVGSVRLFPVITMRSPVPTLYHSLRLPLHLQLFILFPTFDSSSFYVRFQFFVQFLPLFLPSWFILIRWFPVLSYRFFTFVTVTSRFCVLLLFTLRSRLVYTFVRSQFWLHFLVWFSSFLPFYVGSFLVPSSHTYGWLVYCTFLYLYVRLYPFYYVIGLLLRYVQFGYPGYVHSLLHHSSYYTTVLVLRYLLPSSSFFDSPIFLRSTVLLFLFISFSSSSYYSSFPIYSFYVGSHFTVRYTVPLRSLVYVYHTHAAFTFGLVYLFPCVYVPHQFTFTPTPCPYVCYVTFTHYYVGWFVPVRLFRALRSFPMRTLITLYLTTPVWLLYFGYCYGLFLLRFVGSLRSFICYHVILYLYFTVTFGSVRWLLVTFGLFYWFGSLRCVRWFCIIVCIIIYYCVLLNLGWVGSSGVAYHPFCHLHER